MALIKIETYIVKNAIKMLHYNLGYGNKVFQDYYREHTADIRLSYWERLMGKSIHDKYLENVPDYFTILLQLREQNKLDEYSHSALLYAAHNTDRLMEFVHIQELSVNHVLVDLFEYELVHFFCEDEYKAMLDKPEMSH